MKQVETDVAIIAAGPAGLCAAVAAAEGGAEVHVFEKMETFGGAANMGMGPFAVESSIQRKTLINLKKEDAFRKFMDYVHWRADAKLVHDYIWKSADTIDWLQDMGVRFAGAVKNFPESEATWHVVMPENGHPGPRCASAMNKAIFEHAEELGVVFHFNTPAKSLIKEDGEVIGLIAECDGEEIEVMAGAVIIATGGFGTSPEMVKEFTGYELGKEITTFMIPGIVGDGLHMAWEAGAGKSRINMERTAGFGLPGVTTGEKPEAILFAQAGPVVINKSGWRVCDESVMQNASVAGSIIDFQQDHVVYAVMDDSMVQFYRKHGVDFPRDVFQVDPTIGFEEAWPKYAQEYPEDAFIADSLEELAEKMAVNKNNLLETIADYNKFCETGFDDDFGKDRYYMHALTGPKFYALKMTLNAYGSLGGIRIDHKLRALTDNYEVIPGLFAAGTDACDLYTDTYYYYFPGNTMGFAVNSGRMAGEYAARYSLGEDI